MNEVSWLLNSFLLFFSFLFLILFIASISLDFTYKKFYKTSLFYFCSLM